MIIFWMRVIRCLRAVTQMLRWRCWCRWCRLCLREEIMVAPNTVQIMKNLH